MKREHSPVRMMKLQLFGFRSVRAGAPNRFGNTRLAETYSMGALLVNDFCGKVNRRVIVIQMRFECLPNRLGIYDSNVIGMLCNQ